jgi:hypothetical protein
MLPPQKCSARDSRRLFQKLRQLRNIYRDSPRLVTRAAGACPRGRTPRSRLVVSRLIRRREAAGGHNFSICLAVVLSRCLLLGVKQTPPVQSSMSTNDPKRTYEAKFHKGPRACRSGALEIIIRPENGWLSSKIRKIAHDADSAKRDRQVKTVAFKAENRLKLAKMMMSQRTKIARNGVGIALSDSANRMRRVCTKSVLSCAARV